MLKRTCQLFILYLKATVLLAQCPPSSFSINEILCIEQNLDLENTTGGSNSYEWDFCADNLSENPASILVTTDGDFFRARSIKVIKQDSEWFAFAVSQTSNNLMRLDFGQNPYSIPIVNDLGKFDGAFNSAFDIEAININGVWNVLIANTGQGNILRLKFNNGLYDLSPELIDMGDFNKLSSPTHILAVKDINNYHLFVSDGKELVNISFDGSLDNISPSIESYLIPGSSLLRGFSLVKNCDQWVGVILSYNNKLFSIDFNNSLSNTFPSINQLNTSGMGISFPANIQIINDRDQFYGFIQGALGTLHRLNFGENLFDFSFTADLLNVENIEGDQNFALDIIKNISQWSLFNFNLDQKALIRLDFINSCSSNIATSNEFAPGGINYNESGKYYITLKTKDNNGNISYFLDSVMVANSTAPDIQFNHQNACQGSPIQFIGENISGDISNYSWSFGDNTTSTASNPSHTYTTPGNYNVKLSVTSTNGCSNYSEKLITVYPEPSPSFDLPSGLVCTNDTYTFENTTLGDFEGNVKWEWQIDGNVVSTSRDLNYEFTNNGDHEVKLTAEIPGCSTEITQTISNIQEGPLANFNANDDCVGQTFQFNNTSSGAISSYQWDFGNGFTSNLESPAFEYANAGTYDVTLTLSNAAGCQSDIIKSLNVYELPNVQFNNELACEESPTQFNDASQINDANLQTWLWDFDDETNSAERNPSHNFKDAGNYDVKLTVSTTNGCIDSIGQVVNVKPAPAVDFSYDKLCLDETIQFTDETQSVPGEDIISWAWDLGGVFSSEKNPQRTFEFPITYNIGLTVGSENLCSATLYKSIKINPVPEVYFDIDDACINTVTHLYDKTSIEGDQVISRNWNLANMGIESDSSIYHKFPGLGSYEVELSISTANGCAYNSLQDVEIFPSPTAKFSTSAIFGAPPLEVDFNNESEDAESFLWNFNDGATSTENDPTHVFNEEDIYHVELIAADINQCRDTATQIISVLDPDLELELVNSFIQEGSLILALRNNGTITIDSFSVSLDLGDQAVLNETVTETIMPAEQINKILKVGVSKINVKYLCVKVQALINGITDSNLENNTKCLDIDSKNIVILPPKPNPANNQTYINLISKVKQSADFYIYDTRGRLVKQISIGKLNIGFNQVAIDISDLQSELYIIKVLSGEELSSFRLTVHN